MTDCTSPEGQKRGLSFVVNIGRWGGVYIGGKGAFRICLGWIAFTIYPFDLDELMVPLVNAHDALKRKLDDALQELAFTREHWIDPQTYNEEHDALKRGIKNVTSRMKSAADSGNIREWAGGWEAEDCVRSWADSLDALLAKEDKR